MIFSAKNKSRMLRNSGRREIPSGKNRKRRIRCESCWGGRGERARPVSRRRMTSCLCLPGTEKFLYTI